MPSLSVVIAVSGGEHRLPALLAALDKQRDERVEVLVCFPAGAVGVVRVAARQPWAVSIQGDRDALAPHLWRDGIARAQGDRVALLTVHLMPGPGWIDSLLEADLQSYVAVGGAIDNDPSANALGWAIYIQRYARFGRPFEARESLDLAGDGSVYDRSALARHSASWADGFWEPTIHALLHDEGCRLAVDPSIVAIHTNGYAFFEFAAMRIAHGRQYGRDRGRNMSRVGRLAYFIATPIAPLVFFAKLMRGALRRPATRSKLLPALPTLIAFLLAWGTGEVRGALDALIRPTAQPSGPFRSEN